MATRASYAVTVANNFVDVTSDKQSILICWYLLVALAIYGLIKIVVDMVSLARAAARMFHSCAYYRFGSPMSSGQQFGQQQHQHLPAGRPAAASQDALYSTTIAEEVKTASSSPRETVLCGSAKSRRRVRVVRDQQVLVTSPQGAKLHCPSFHYVRGSAQKQWTLCSVCFPLTTLE